MKKAIAVILVVLGIFIFFTISCAKNTRPTGPYDVTPTPTTTPDINFGIYIYDNGVESPGLTLNVYYPGNLQILTKQTNIFGRADFTLHEKGIFTLNIPAQTGFGDLSYKVDVQSNTIFAIDRGQNIEIVAITPTKNKWGFAGDVFDYKVTYISGLSNTYALYIDGLPTAFNASMTGDPVSNYGDTMTVHFTIPPNYDASQYSYITFTVKGINVVNPSDIISTSTIQIYQDWGITLNLINCKVYKQKSGGSIPTSMIRFITEYDYTLLNYSPSGNISVTITAASTGDNGGTGCSTTNFTKPIPMPTYATAIVGNSHQFAWYSSTMSTTDFNNLTGFKVVFEAKDDGGMSIRRTFYLDPGCWVYDSYYGWYTKTISSITGLRQ